MPTPHIIDLSHHNIVEDFSAIKAAGVVGIIHKCTEGVSFVDSKYKRRREIALRVGLQWSSYHFMRAGNAGAQMEHYLRNADVRPGERVCLDFEEVTNGPDPTILDLSSAIQYLQRVDPSLEITVYSGNLIKELLGTVHNETLAATSLWIAQYNRSGPDWPKETWPAYSLWQYTDKGKVSGTKGDIDLNQFNGTAENCVKWMAPQVVAPSPVPPEEERVVTISVPKGVRVEVKYET